jgi:uncharacterized protein (DUF433 family)
MPVATLLASMAGGMSISQILKEWTFLEKEDILQALAYAALETEERFIPTRA